jgi:hypothetical protein
LNRLGGEKVLRVALAEGDVPSGEDRIARVVAGIMGLGSFSASLQE